ncbi:MAG: hypothetical protein AAFX03_04335 [Pseudomonadota bacterium]
MTTGAIFFVVSLAGLFFAFISHPFFYQALFGGRRQSLDISDCH